MLLSTFLPTVPPKLPLQQQQQEVGRPGGGEGCGGDAGRRWWGGVGWGVKSSIQHLNSDRCSHWVSHAKPAILPTLCWPSYIDASKSLNPFTYPTDKQPPPPISLYK